MGKESWEGRLAFRVTALPDATGLPARFWNEAIRAKLLPCIEASPRRRLVLVEDLEAFLRARRSDA